MILGFTGTQRDLSGPQARALRSVLNTALGPFVELHHGDCVGADDEAHTIGMQLGYYLYVHPPTNDYKAVGHLGHYRYEPKPFLDRNADIARICKLLIACPSGMAETQRSGTWSTVRRARDRKKDILFCFPDGTRKLEREVDRLS